MKQQQLEFNLTADVHDLLPVLISLRTINALKPKPTETGQVLPFKKIEASQALEGSTVSQAPNTHSHHSKAHHAYPLARRGGVDLLNQRLSIPDAPISVHSHNSNNGAYPISHQGEYQ